MTPLAPDSLDRHVDWDGVRALVVGLGVSGFAAADSLTHLGAQVTVLDDADSGRLRDKATLLEILGADVRLGPGVTAQLPPDLDLVVTSPGRRPHDPLLTDAAARGLPVWGELELAWRLRADDSTPWLVVAGTHGAASTTDLLAAILRADGLNTATVGNGRVAVLEAVMNPEPVDALVVELSSAQLHWSSSLSAAVSTVLNLAPDHVDWHGSAGGYEAAMAKAYEHTQQACVYNVQDPRTEHLVQAADVIEGCRGVGFTLGIPAPGMVGLVDGVLADRAFVAARSTSAAELCSVSRLQSSTAEHVANALAAATMARAHGVSTRAVRDGLYAAAPSPHHLVEIAAIEGVRFVDDSCATDPYTAGTSVREFDSVVWVAGGVAKGADFAAVIESIRPRLRGVVLLGRDRAVIADALARHAPDVHMVEVENGETDPMDRVVDAAASLAQPGDTVLLAPGCGSMDQFADCAARGEAFAAAVRRFRST